MADLDKFQPPRDGEYGGHFFNGLDIERSLTEKENALLSVCITVYFAFIFES